MLDGSGPAVRSTAAMLNNIKCTILFNIAHASYVMHGQALFIPEDTLGNVRWALFHNNIWVRFNSQWTHKIPWMHFRWMRMAHLKSNCMCKHPYFSSVVMLYSSDVHGEVRATGQDGGTGRSAGLPGETSHKTRELAHQQEYQVSPRIACCFLFIRRLQHLCWWFRVVQGSFRAPGEGSCVGSRCRGGVWKGLWCTGQASDRGAVYLSSHCYLWKTV